MLSARGDGKPKLLVKSACDCDVLKLCGGAADENSDDLRTCSGMQYSSMKLGGPNQRKLRYCTTVIIGMEAEE
eukprot:12410933-Karenia_brevis.AAC.1